GVDADGEERAHDRHITGRHLPAGSPRAGRRPGDRRRVGSTARHMGFLQPSPPPFDLEEWKAKPFLARLKPNVQDWAMNGFGAPGIVYVLYLAKLLVFVFGAWLLIAETTPGIGGLGHLGRWWTQPIVFQKVVVWTLLWEIAGLG